MNLSVLDDRRHTFRTPYCSPAGYTNGTKFGVGTVENIGPNGMFLGTAELFDLGETLDIEFQFRHGHQKMNLQGEIVRITNDGLGIRLLWQ